KEISSEMIWSLFRETYLREDGIQLIDYTLLPEPRAHERRIAASVEIDGAERQIEGVGNGPIAAFVDALKRECGIGLTVLDYHENAVGAGADAQAAAYVQIRDNGGNGAGGTLYGVGMDSDIVTASLKAVASAATRATQKAAGMTQYGVNLLRLPPGAWSSQRHWHTAGDEFVYVLSGEIVLVTDAGEEVLRAGDAAGFPANDPNGHCLQNRSDRPAEVLEIG